MFYACSKPISGRLDIAFATKTVDWGLIHGQIQPKTKN